MWRQAVGVDHRGDRIGGVMETVNKLEPERDQQRDAQQDEGADGDWRGVRRVDVTDDAVQDKSDADTEQDNEDDGATDMWSRVKFRPCRDGNRECFRHADPLVLLSFRLQASDAG